VSTKIIKYLIYIIFLLAFNKINAQEVYERNSLEVYQFLSSMSQKGYIEWNDLITPASKEKIKNALTILEAKQSNLNTLEKKEMIFYLNEYFNKRKKLVHQFDSSFSLNLDPIIVGGYVKGENINYKETGVGVSIWGNAGKNLGYQFSFVDINQNGSQLDTNRNFIYQNSKRGIVALNEPNIKQQINYTDLRGSLVYHFKKGQFSAGQDALTWGYGENGQMVLSNKAPYYPYIRLDYMPLPWLNFNYTHAFLQSGIIDTLNSYSIPSGVFPADREVNIKKYMASHSIDIRLKKGIQLSIGESIIYNDQLQLGYLLPIMFFKANDNTLNNGVIQAGSNGQFFGQISTKNILVPKSQFYSTLFIDEIRVSSIFDPVKSRNQIGFNFGFVKQDFVISNFIVGAEYTRLNPFLYRNFLPAQNYTNNGYSLGEWIGSNSDKFIVFAKYSPAPRLKTYVRYQHIRKSQDGTMQDQYFGQPQLNFLQNSADKYNYWYFKTSYEITNRFYLNFSFSKLNNVRKEYFKGFSYGL
jgi:hypothetical protein